MNTIQLDIKDENGEVAFHRLAPRLARRVALRCATTRHRQAVKKLHADGIYVVGGRLFEDPILSEKRPDLAIRRQWRLWRNTPASAGRTRTTSASDYNLAIAQAAAKAGFDEIQSTTFVARATETSTMRSSPGTERGDGGHDRALGALRDEAP